VRSPYSCGTALDLHQTSPVTSVDRSSTEPNLSVAYFAPIAVLTSIRHHRYWANGWRSSFLLSGCASFVKDDCKRSWAKLTDMLAAIQSNQPESAIPISGGLRQSVLIRRRFEDPRLDPVAEIDT